MKRKALIKHLEKNGAEFKREGSNHTIYGLGNDVTEVPRHTEIDDNLARKICKDLNIPFVR
jgi:predicted RNA binding protein YcfA (HicA-like mRNA interferase family)